MTKKFGRTYRLTIDPKDGGDLIVIELPFTVQFWLQRDTYASLNRFTIDVYNLSASNRSRIFQDRFDMAVVRPDGSLIGRTVTFEVGYSTLYQIYSGTIYQASSAREGTNLVTRIQCLSGLFDTATTQVFTTISGQQTLGDVFRFLIPSFPNLKVGAIGGFDQNRDRPWVISGNAYNWIKNQSDNSAFIDNDKVYILQQNEVIKGDAYTIDDSTGLLETPRRDDAFLSITSLLEPGVNVAQYLDIQSSVAREYNGRYKVAGMNHQGIISEATSGTAKSTFKLIHPGFFREGIKEIEAN